MSQLVLITGCSSGFGLLTAVAAARAGHRVVATMRDVSRRQALDEAALHAGVALDVRSLDLDAHASIEACVAAVMTEYGRVDALVNNAGFGLGGAVLDLSMDELRAQFETNLFGTVALTKAVLPGMIARRSGRIVQISSANSLHSAPGIGAYAASKRALDGLSEALRLEVAPFGVHVTSVLPGQFRTEAFTKRRLAAGVDAADSPYFELSRKMLAKVDEMVATQAGDPAQVAEEIVRLLTPPRPPLKVLVGRDVKLQTFIRNLVPERAWQALVARATGFDVLC